MPEQTISLPQQLNRAWIESCGFDQLDPVDTVRLDFAQTLFMDSAGVALIHKKNREFKKAGRQLVLTNISADLLGVLQKWTDSFCELPLAQAKQRPGFLVGLGQAGLAFKNEITQALSVLAEMLYWGTLGMLKRKDIRAGSLGEQMYQLGLRAFGIVGLLAFLIGVVLALQSAMQLRQFGADIFLAPMIGVSMVQELGPLMTAIILAGRTGSATTAEIATMGVQEEIDALKTMSINPIQFVVVPKFWAITLTMPLLAVMAMASGIFGGFLVAVLYLELSPGLFMGELTKYMRLNYFLDGLSKSIVFSWLIIWIGSYYGFKVRGGAEEVGRATTASVVTCIFVIIIADAMFSFVL